ncbi:MAG: SDR family oxidoreductase [Candidatus Bipolaricaulota bacterium]|nr:SDR family oxidoreductase [Candidatus Bipolaricaulota bacterium]
MDELKGKVAVITGGAGVLCTAIAEGLAREGVKIALLDINKEKAEKALDLVRSAGSEGLAVKTSVLSREELEQAAEKILSTLGRVDILINGAGGNSPKATTGSDQSFFDLPEDGARFVFDLNFMGTFLASQAFGKVMADQKEGVILNIASMNAIRPLTRIPAYSAAKAAVANFTQWLAVHMAQEYSPRIRVNAIAPGFFLTVQNRFLLKDDNDELTPRGRQIIDHTPTGRFGTPEDLIGTVNWLLSEAAEFVTGIIVPIDGGFSAYSGV